MVYSNSCLRFLRGGGGALAAPIGCLRRIVVVAFGTGRSGEDVVSSHAVSLCVAGGSFRGGPSASSSTGRLEFDFLWLLRRLAMTRPFNKSWLNLAAPLNIEFMFLAFSRDHLCN